jgi:hypothetical protein
MAGGLSRWESGGHGGTSHSVEASGSRVRRIEPGAA